MRILVVDDEVELCDTIAEGLELDGYAVDTCYNGLNADELISIGSYDLILLDLNLPGINGFDIIKNAKKRNNNIKILIISARCNVDDKIMGLDLGACDYLEKPFAFDELKARMRNLLNRKFIQNSAVINYKDLSINSNTRKAFAFDTEINLTKKEFGILEYLLLNKNRVISQKELLNHVWDMNADIFSNSVRVHIASLRKKLILVLSYDPIKTKIGEGYYIEGDA